MKYEFFLKALFASGLVAATAQLACSAESSDPYPGGTGAKNNSGSGATAGTGGTGSGATAGTVGAGATAGTPGTGGTVGTGGTPATGGTVGTGGATGGSGGTATCAPQTGSATDLAISDLEAATNAIAAPRTGYWFTFGEDGGATNIMPPPDPTGQNPFAPAAGGPTGSTYYAHFTCTGGTYVGMGFAFNDCGSKPNPYNISAYTGISLSYKSSHNLRVMLTSMATTQPTFGGSCTTYCDNVHMVELEAVADWTPVTITLAEFIQGYGDPPVALDKTQVLQLQFQVAGVYDQTTSMTNMITPAAVDFGVDNITFN